MKLTALKLLLPLLLAGTFTGVSGETLKVTDATDGSPIAGATLFSKNGLILGMTDASGEFQGINASDFPVSVRCVGYDPESMTSGAGEVSLRPVSYELSDVTVTPGDHPIAHTVCYIREYLSGATGKDTTICYNEHVGDFFHPLRKVKGFKAGSSPRFLTSRQYARISGDGRDTVYMPTERNEMIAWESLISIPTDSVVESSWFAKTGRNSNDTSVYTDTLPGKYGTREILRKTPETFTRKIDYLADKKGHRFSPFIFKLLGLTMDATEMDGTWAYRSNPEGKYSAADIVSGTYGMAITGKGKWIKMAFDTKDPVEMRCVYEIYPLYIEYLTVENAKEMLSTPPKVELKESPYAGPPLPAAQRLVERCTATSEANP